MSMMREQCMSGVNELNIRVRICEWVFASVCCVYVRVCYDSSTKWEVVNEGARHTFKSDRNIQLPVFQRGIVWIRVENEICLRHRSSDIVLMQYIRKSKQKYRKTMKCNGWMTKKAWVNSATQTSICVPIRARVCACVCCVYARLPLVNDAGTTYELAARSLDRHRYRHGERRERGRQSGIQCSTHAYTQWAMSDENLLTLRVCALTNGWMAVWLLYVRIPQRRSTGCSCTRQRHCTYMQDVSSFIKWSHCMCASDVQLCDTWRERFWRGEKREIWICNEHRSDVYERCVSSTRECASVHATPPVLSPPPCVACLCCCCCCWRCVCSVWWVVCSLPPLSPSNFFQKKQSRIPALSTQLACNSFNRSRLITFW